MKTYSPAHWETLGAWIAGARTQAGFSDTKRWAAAAQRSTRQLLGLERGESVGPKTIESVAAALEVESGALFAILESGRTEHTWTELRAAASEEADRLALAQPEESHYWTTPQGDEADEPVTWSHMEGRLSEIEKRILRLERAVLRVVELPRRGGDGDDGSAAPMNDEQIAALDDPENAPGRPEET